MTIRKKQLIAGIVNVLQEKNVFIQLITLIQYEIHISYPSGVGYVKLSSKLNRDLNFFFIFGNELSILQTLFPENRIHPTSRIFFLVAILIFFWPVGIILLLGKFGWNKYSGELDSRNNEGY